MIYKPDPRECALLLLRAIQERGERRGTSLTRARVSATALKLLWNRKRVTPQWLDQVNEWLLTAGWILLDAGTTLGVVKTDVVENWPRIAFAHLEEELEPVGRGNFDFTKLDSLLEGNQAITRPTPRTKARQARRKFKKDTDE